MDIPNSFNVYLHYHAFAFLRYFTWLIIHSLMAEMASMLLLPLVVCVMHAGDSFLINKTSTCFVHAADLACFHSAFWPTQQVLVVCKAVSDTAFQGGCY